MVNCWRFFEPQRVSSLGGLTASIDSTEDYIYFFKAPIYDLREVAIPEMVHKMKVVPSTIGVSELEVDPMCSAWAIHKNGSMGYMYTLTEVEFKNWLEMQK